MHEHALEKQKSPLLDHQLELSIPEEAMHEQALEKQKSPLLDHQLELSIPEEEVIVESEPSMALKRGDRMDEFVWRSTYTYTSWIRSMITWIDGW